MAAEITASLVKELREATNVGMMECKRALTEAGGDMEKAIRLLRERGMVIASKKSSRVANEGLIAAEVEPGAQSGVMIEVNCETDFVARNETFRAFVAELVQKAKAVEGSLAEACRDELVAKVAEIGENLVIRRNLRYEVSGTGAVASYIHLGGKVGVLLEVGCEKPETVNHDGFKEAVKDVTLHIAAANPAYLDRSQVPAETIEAEQAIFAKQAEGKPAQIIEKIVAGKLEKYYAQVCLLEQGFVKDQDLSVSQMLAARGKEFGDTLTIRRFARYQIGG